MNQTLQNLLNIITIAAGAIGKTQGGEVGEYALLASDVTAIAQLAVSIHQQNTGLPIEQVIAQLHEIPGPQGGQVVPQPSASATFIATPAVSVGPASTPSLVIHTPATDVTK